MIKDKKCRYCGTTQNLIRRQVLNGNTVNEKVIYRNECYDCSNAKKLKGKCRHCGTTRDLMTRKVMNQYLKKPKVVTQDVCRKCFGDMTRANQTGKKRSKETRKKISDAVRKWENTSEGKKKLSDGQKNRYKSEEQRKISGDRLKLLWKDPKFAKQKSKESIKRWKDLEYRKSMSKGMSKRSKDYWKDPEYRRMRSITSKEIWNKSGYKEAASKRQKEALKNRDRFSPIGLPVPSKTEQELFELVKTIYPKAESNESIKTKVSRRYPDIIIHELKLIIEYDGSYFHRNKDDKIRDKELNEIGYRTLHYIDHVPSQLDLFGDIRTAVLGSSSNIYREAA